MKFSIVVAAYNVAEYLEECVDSLANQNFPNSEYEVVIVDDGSTDGQTGNLCDQLTSKYEVVRTIHQENGGLSSARNTGIKESNRNIYYLLMGTTFGVIQNFFIHYRKILKTIKVMSSYFLIINITDQMIVLKLVSILFLIKVISMMNWLN